MSNSTHPVAIIMGSQSDWPTMRNAAEILDALGVGYEAKIISAHRTPDRMADFAKSAKSSGFKVIIAGAGGAAHLPGMTAAMTPLPVLGVPVQSKALSGQDSLLSIVQMPAGIPVGTLAIGRAGAVNAGLMAAAILATTDDALAARLDAWRQKQSDSIALAPVDDAPKTNNQHRRRSDMLQPGDTIGILGGGQLGRMMALAASKIGLKSHIYCPDPASPAFDVSSRHTCADYEDKAALETFASSVKRVTYEFENIPAATVEFLKNRLPVLPDDKALRTSQDRLTEKRILSLHRHPHRWLS